MDPETKDPVISQPAPTRELSPQAQRALAEADERRRARDLEKADTPDAPEVGGRKGPDPARYGDWEKGGIASDF